ncbi:FtsH protease activity modulator HflK [Devosia sp.]|uniref:FtsH protease activity modulator HflK n=1 Tax=Devosia sp. TaxID=1871048 RepID=UPI003264CAF0
MPWENNGGGGDRNKNGGPWGQSPGGGGGGPRKPGGGNTPNLEDILNRGRDRFQGGLNGGIPGGRWALIGGALAVVAFWALNSIYTIDPQEVGVELRFGKPKPDLSMPGLHFHLWPIDTVERVTVTENQTIIGNSSSNSRPSNDEGLMLSGDQNIVDVQFSALWSVSNPIDYLFNVRDPEDLVRGAAESAMREVVGRRPAQDIFRDDKAGIAIEVQEITQGIVDSYGMGVRVSQIAIENVAPPAEVADAFNEVQRAEQDEDRFQEEARSYANTLLGNARGRAAQMREDAAAYKNRVVQEATGQASRFDSIYAEYVNSPEVTRKRLFLETMEQVLAGSQKTIIEKGAEGSGVVPYLPLPALTAVPADKTTTTGN